MFIEKVVEALISVVDAQLFETVFAEILEPEYVEDRDSVLRWPPRALAGDDLVEPRDQPGEQGGVQGLRDSISGIWTIDLNVEYFRLSFIKHFLKYIFTI